jgi:hypothetical protein
LFLKALLRLSLKTHIGSEFFKEDTVADKKRIEKTKADEDKARAIEMSRNKMQRFSNDIKYFNGLDEMAKKHANEITLKTFKKYREKFMSFEDLYAKGVTPPDGVNFREWKQPL